MSKRNKKQLDIVDPSPFIKDLSSDQLEAFTDMVKFIDTPDDSMLVLKGYAGTGKTFTITRFIQYCLEMTRQHIKTKNVMAAHKYGTPAIAMTAPTNKAVQVLREHSDKSLFGKVHFSTIHQLLGLKEVINDSGEQEFRNDRDKNPEITRQDILIIDEVSMLNDDLFILIWNYAPTIKIIMLGDPKQVPPVGKEDCEPFLNPMKYNIRTIELSRIMRQKEGSAIIEASFHIRNDITNPAHSFSAFTSITGTDLQLFNANLQRNELITVMKEKVLSEAFVQNPNIMKVIAWRNAKVNEYNIYIPKIYGLKKWPEIDMATAPKILAGDRMIANEPVIKYEFNMIVILMHTNQEFIVLRSNHVEARNFEYVNGSVDLETYVVVAEFYSAELDKMVEEKITVLHENSKEEFERTVQKLKNSALHATSDKRGFFWREYYHFIRQFANVTYAYAITAHKSQGSTYDEVFVDVNDIRLNQNVVERNRILYTAITRAKNNLTLIN